MHTFTPHTRTSSGIASINCKGRFIRLSNQTCAWLFHTEVKVLRMDNSRVIMTVTKLPQLCTLASQLAVMGTGGSFASSSSLGNNSLLRAPVNSMDDFIRPTYPGDFSQSYLTICQPKVYSISTYFDKTQYEHRWLS